MIEEEEILKLDSPQLSKEYWKLIDPLIQLVENLKLAELLFRKCFLLTIAMELLASH